MCGKMAGGGCMLGGGMGQEPGGCAVDVEMLLETGVI